MPTRTFNDTFNAGIYTDNFGVKSTLVNPVKTGSQSLIWESGHYGYPRFNKPDVGGPFNLSYNYSEQGIVSVGAIRGSGPYSNHHYKGSVSTKTFFGYAQEPMKDSSTFGAMMYSRMKPDRPAMQLLNALYELKDVPGMLKQRFTQHGLSELGSYYLAQKFGWDALAQDIVSLVVTQIQAQKRLEQLIRDEGKPVRRRINLPDTQTILQHGTAAGGIQFYPQFVTYFYNGASGFENTETLTTRRWASAQFRYWLPPGPRNIDWKASQLAKIFGLKPTPKVIFNAIPWTWLIDWFTHVSNLLDNLQTSIVDRLAADYFYVMCHNERCGTNRCWQTFVRDPDGSPVVVEATGYTRSGTKSRLRGDPFGWATPEVSLSGVQLSILGALGLSRLR